MEDQDDARPLPVQKSSGVTDSERYLATLCQKNFLSLWSYPRPFRYQGGPKEICDLLVVMGDDIIVFSDKHCLLEPKSTLEVDWRRWFRSAVEDSAAQAWGAEQWLRKHPDRVFLDPDCTRPLPVRLPPPERARYHLAVTVHGVSAACQAMLGGTGSLMMRTDVRGFAAHVQPFVIGDLDPTRSFVHVFDDATLDIVMSTLDTATDFLRYLREKEQLVRSRVVFAAGEENLLAHYLTHVGDDGGHAFVFDHDVDAIFLDESLWSSFASSKQRREQLEHDAGSYLWDSLIEEFCHHALAATQYFRTDPPVESAEIILRFMAAEPRLIRRVLADVLRNSIESTPSNQRRTQVVPAQSDNRPTYVFLVFPWIHKWSKEKNRTMRRKFLEACVWVAKLKFPRATDIVGIATETGTDHSRRSEDAVYFDAREWSDADEERARSYQRDLGILVSDRLIGMHFSEYPDDRSDKHDRRIIPKNPRNKRLRVWKRQEVQALSRMTSCIAEEGLNRKTLPADQR